MELPRACDCTHGRPLRPPDPGERTGTRQSGRVERAEKTVMKGLEIGGKLGSTSALRIEPAPVKLQPEQDCE